MAQEAALSQAPWGSIQQGQWSLVMISLAVWSKLEALPSPNSPSVFGGRCHPGPTPPGHNILPSLGHQGCPQGHERKLSAHIKAEPWVGKWMEAEWPSRRPGRQVVSSPGWGRWPSPRVSLLLSFQMGNPGPSRPGWSEGSRWVPAHVDPGEGRSHSGSH